MLLDCNRVVSAPFNGCVIYNDHTVVIRHPAYAGNDASGGHLVCVQLVTGQCGQLEKRRVRVRQPVDSLAG